ncbi:MAG TPA: HEAT repeat domain-containing protein, partial [Candidatus Krumholzibacteria bacterium]
TALWQAEFANIFYRVLDEQSDGAANDGAGSGSSGREQPLRSHDHQDLPAPAAAGSRHAADALLETMGAHFDSLTGSSADPVAHEKRLQQLYVEQVGFSAGELSAWMQGPRAGDAGDELLVFLRGVLEFTAMRLTPPVIRDVNDTIERLVHYIRDEGNIATLTTTLEIVAGIEPDALEAGFAALPDRIEVELTNPDYLVSLARGLRAGNDPHEVLRYLALAGDGATAALCDLLARSTDETIHERACDILHGCAGAALPGIVETFDTENAWLAADAVRLLLRTTPTTIPPVIQRILGSQDPEIRRCAIDYLARLATDESAQRLCALFNDPSLAVRVRAFSSVGQFAHPAIKTTLTTMCFADDAVQRAPDELEHMFRALGKGAGIEALPPIRQVIGKKHYLPAGKARSKRDKLLVITALKYIPGDESRALLESLSRDADQLVKTKALHVLKQRQAGSGSDVDYPAAPTRTPGGTA